MPAPQTPPLTPPLTPPERQFIEDFGNLYEQFGLQRLVGLLVGLVLTQPEPVSLDDLAALLGRSKGPISNAVREMAAIGLLRKVDGPVARRDYYEAHPDLFLNNFRFSMETVRKNRLLAERHLAASLPPPLRRQLDQMQAFYAFMESFYRDFEARWEQAKPSLSEPSASPDAPVA